MQGDIWEKEYNEQRFVSLSTEPIVAIKDFVRWLRKEVGLEIDNLKILDLGCGNAKNSLYISEQGLGNEIVGIDISGSALRYARELAPEGKFLKQNIGEPLPFPDTSFDIALDVTSSNSIREKEREVYLNETHRVLRPSGFLFVRALCRDGDANAKNLLKSNPGKEKDTYIMPELGLVERVFSREDFLETYSSLFESLYLKKETHYTKFSGKLYKRNFWIGYWRKK